MFSPKYTFEYRAQNRERFYLPVVIIFEVAGINSHQTSIRIHAQSLACPTSLVEV